MHFSKDLFPKSFQDNKDHVKPLHPLEAKQKVTTMIIACSYKLESDELYKHTESAKRRVYFRESAAVKFPSVFSLTVEKVVWLSVYNSAITISTYCCLAGPGATGNREAETWKEDKSGISAAAKRLSAWRAKSRGSLNKTTFCYT